MQVASFVHVGDGQENYAFLWAEGLCASLLALLGEMNAVIMLAASCKYWDVNKKHHVLVRNHIHVHFTYKLCMHRYTSECYAVIKCLPSQQQAPAQK